MIWKKISSLIMLSLLLCCIVSCAGEKNDPGINSIAENTGSIRIRLAENQIKTSHGVTYEGEDGYWHVYGTPDGTGFITLAGGTEFIPEWIESGKKIYVDFDTDTAAKLVFRAFNTETPDGITLLATQVSTSFTVPDLSSYTGIAIRLQVPGGTGDIDTILHPVLSYEPKMPVPDYGRPMLTIIDDDGDIHYLKDILPLCEEMDINISTAVTTTRVGSSSRWMSWDDIKACYDKGIEVLCHTYSHPTPSALEDVSDEEIVKRFDTALSLLQSNGIETGDILVYSSSTGYMERVRDAASRVFKAGIVIGGGTVNTKNSDPYNLKRFRIDYATGDGDLTKEDYNLDDMKEYIDSVASNGGWAIWMFHTSNSKWRQIVDVNSEGNIVYDENGNVIPLFDDNGEPILDEDGSQFERTVGHLVYVPKFKTAINYAKEKGVEIVTTKDGLKSCLDR